MEGVLSADNVWVQICGGLILLAVNALVAGAYWLRKQMNQNKTSNEQLIARIEELASDNSDLKETVEKLNGTVEKQNKKIQKLETEQVQQADKYKTSLEGYNKLQGSYIELKEAFDKQAVQLITFRTEAVAATSALDAVQNTLKSLGISNLFVSLYPVLDKISASIIDDDGFNGIVKESLGVDKEAEQVIGQETKVTEIKNE